MSGDHLTMPDGLGAAGSRLWRSIADDFELDGRERDVLERACRQADDVRKLEQVVALEGVTCAGSTGQLRVNPAVIEVRQGRSTVARLLGQLDLPAEQQAEPASMAAARASRAAHGRWDRQTRVRSIRGAAS